MAVSQRSEFLPVKGIEFVSPLAPDCVWILSIGVAGAVQETEAAKAFIKFVTSPAAVPLIKAKGLEPG
jgi:molybdate transport system substrate-binding protein